MSGETSGAPRPAIGPVTAHLVGLCATTGARLRTPALRDQVAALGARLGEPRIRIAIGGRMNAGKSTLVNALLRQRLAATGATETTRLVTWFRHGTQDRVRVHRRDGTSRVVPAAPGGGVPADLRAGEGEEIASLTVETPNHGLWTRHTIVDTPGLNSLSHLDPDSLAALGAADAVVYLMPHPGERDVEAIGSLRDPAGGLRLGAANVLGVLSRIDTLTSEGDPWPTARRVSARYARELAASLSDVVPVAGLLAETALGGDFTEADGRAVRRLAEVDRFDVEEALTSVAEFRAWTAGPLTDAERDRLLGLLGLHGARVALELLDEGHRSTRALLDGFARRSGIVDISERIATMFVGGADRLRAGAGITALEEMAQRAEDEADRRVLGRLQDTLDRLRHEPALRQAELAGALVDAGAGRVQLDPDDTGRLKALATGCDDARRVGLPADADHAAVAAAADAQIPRWRVLEARPSPRLARHARTARELCEHLYFHHVAAGDAETRVAAATR